MRVKITESKLKNLVSRVVNEELRRFNNDDRRIKSALRESIKSVLSESTREEIKDFFKLIEKDIKAGSFATVYYTALYDRFNKSYVDENGNKQVNPYRDRVYKHQYILFNWGETYKRAVERKNPDWEMRQRKGEFVKFDGYDVIEAGKNGLCLPVIPKGGDASYTVVDDNGNHHPIEYKDFEPYMAKRKSSNSGSGVGFRLLLVDRIYQIKAGGNDWINPHFEFTYLGPE